MSQTMTPEAVAAFLQANPEFFQQHADLFADLRVPHPYEARAISLGERQILTLRNRCKELEWKLADLLHTASGNERISQQLKSWCCDMLAENDAAVLPSLVESRLKAIFDLPCVALRLWGKDAPAPFLQEVGDTVRQYAASLANPYCGPAEGCPAVEWMAPETRSMVCIALKPEGGRNAFGLLMMGSNDPGRFTPDMGTDFLQTIGRLASAGLLRLPDLEASDQA